MPTVTDIIKELEKPGRDPRPEFKTAQFADGVETMNDLQPGMILEGAVTNVTNFGAFVDIGEGVTGLLHVSQISQKRIKSPADVLKVGQKVRVKITKVADGRVSLSMKAIEDEGDPQTDTREEHYDLPKSEEIGTGLGALLKNIRL